MEFNCKRCAHETHCRLICMGTDEFPPYILCSRFQVRLYTPLLDENDESQSITWDGVDVYILVVPIGKCQRAKYACLFVRTDTE